MLSLTTANPALAAEWHPTKNGDLLPTQVAKCANRKVWWLDKHGHEWEAMISGRFNGSGCPYCSGRKVLPGFNDLATISPALASEWHPTKNGDLLPTQVTKCKTRKVWWLGKCGHEWEVRINNRLKGTGCPYCSGLKTLPGFNDLATVNPSLASEWHPTKNGDLLPTQVTKCSAKKAWWLGKCGHEWEATILSRSNGKGCPYCAGRKVLQGFNDLVTTNPVLASEWHPTKNGDLHPTQVTNSSTKKVWWFGKCGHEWHAQVCNRSRGTRCPYCSGNKVLIGFNDLATTNPRLAEEWHPVRNDTLSASQVTTYSNKKVWWLGKCGHEWEAMIFSRSHGTRCPYCYGNHVSKRRDSYEV